MTYNRVMTTTQSARTKYLDPIITEFSLYDVSAADESDPDPIYVDARNASDHIGGMITLRNHIAYNELRLIEQKEWGSHDEARYELWNVGVHVAILVLATMPRDVYEQANAPEQFADIEEG